MRRKDKQISVFEELEAILRKSDICRLALNDEDYPYVIPMNHGYKDSTLYFHCAADGRKIELIRKNNRAAFEVETDYYLKKSEKACKWTAGYSSVIGRGTIEIIDDTEKIKEGLDIIMSHHSGPVGSYDDKYLKKMLILKLSIINMTGKKSK